MDLRTALAGVKSYSHLAGKEQAAQQHLWQIPRTPPPELPLGLRVRVSGSGQSLPLVPWIALLDSDVTTTATDGLYLVYLFDRALERVYLSMNQGATQHLRQAESDGLKGRSAELAALTEISLETRALRTSLDSSMLEGTNEGIDLHATNFLPRGYEAGSIAAIEYSMADLPQAGTLADDVERFSVLYRRCVEVKDDLAANRHVRTSARSEKKRKPPAAAPVFRPKDSHDYVVNVGASTSTRTRAHEALIEAFGRSVLDSGRVAATNVHPRDLTIQDAAEHWLVEAKTVGPNAELAVREAIGQLYSYRHFCYLAAGHPAPKLLALFSAPIGRAFEELLASLGIDVVYRSGGSWGGSAAGLRLIGS